MFSDIFFSVVTDLSMLPVVKTVVSLKGSRVKIARFVYWKLYRHNFPVPQFHGYYILYIDCLCNKYSLCFCVIC